MWITCGLLWCFYQLFGLSFWRHPFTAEDPLVNKWCNAKLLQIWWWSKLIYILDLGLGWVHFSKLKFWLNYSININDDDVFRWCSSTCVKRVRRHSERRCFQTASAVSSWSSLFQVWVISSWRFLAISVKLSCELCNRLMQSDNAIIKRLSSICVFLSGEVESYECLSSDLQKNVLSALLRMDAVTKTKV